MLTYVMIGVLVILVFLCVSEFLIDLRRRR
jgi:hypothetical protein